MDALDTEVIHRFLSEVGNRCRRPAKLHLLGGSALFLLDSSRPTVDIDYVGPDIDKDELQHTIDEVAAEMRLEADAVRLGDCIRIPPDAAERHRFFGRFGPPEVYIFDPYSIALAKIERGFDTDIDDVAFLVRSRTVGLSRLNEIIDWTLAHSQSYDLSARVLRRHFEAALRRADLDTIERIP
jgi:hypothetical protein